MRFSKKLLDKKHKMDSTTVKVSAYFTLRADWNQDVEESLVNLANVDSADVPRVIH